MHTRSAPVYPVKAVYAWVFLPLFSVISCAPAPRFTVAHARPSIEKKSPPKPMPEKKDSYADAPAPASAGEIVSGRLSAEAALKPAPSNIAPPAPVKEPETSGRFVQEGMAAWYGTKFNGRKTASGERFNMHKCTAAHRTLPFNSRVKVTNLKNKASVVVRINDRGPFVKSRIIDLSRAAARKIGLDRLGTAPVRIELAQENDQ
jgi:rare lipoprotein A (peptidoglycan hydrolase)